MRRAIAKEQGRPDAWCAGVPPREQSRRAAAEWLLSLAAAPTFAVMAAFTASRGDMPDMLCSMAVNSSPLTGMWLMYLLMSAFHLAPWLKLLSGRALVSHGVGDH
jgi:hypothetical protein